MRASVAIPIVLRSGSLVIVDKPAGMLSVPGRGAGKQDCVAARARAMFPDATGPLIVHRLDMETSGLMALALDPHTHRDLSMQFERRAVEKAYEALLRGDVQGDSGEIRLWQRLDVDNRPMQILDDDHGKEAITRWSVLERRDGLTRLRFEPVTGRTHQLRVAASAPIERGGLGCPIVGDSLYGIEGDPPERLMLHATTLALRDPELDERLEAHSPAPF